MLTSIRGIKYGETRRWPRSRSASAAIVSATNLSEAALDRLFRTELYEDVVTGHWLEDAGYTPELFDTIASGDPNAPARSELLLMKPKVTWSREMDMAAAARRTKSLAGKSVLVVAQDKTGRYVAPTIAAAAAP